MMTTNQVVDLQSALIRIGGDRILLKRIVQLFLEDAPLLRKDISRGITEANFSDVLRAAHSLRGLAANLDARTVVSITEAIERASHRSDWEHVLELARELEIECERLETQLK